MTRLVVYLALSLVVALGAAWLIALPGTVLIDFGPYRLEPGLGTALFILIGVVILAVIALTLLRHIIDVPGKVAPRQCAPAQDRRGRGAFGRHDRAAGRRIFQGPRHWPAKRAPNCPTMPPPSLLEARAELALGDLPAAREHYRALDRQSRRPRWPPLPASTNRPAAQDRPKAALTFARKALAHVAPASIGLPKPCSTISPPGAPGPMRSPCRPTLPARTRAQKAAKKRRQGVLETALAHRHGRDPARQRARPRHYCAQKSIPDFVPAALSPPASTSIAATPAAPRRCCGASGAPTPHPDIATLYAHVKPGSFGGRTAQAHPGA